MLFRAFNTGEPGFNREYIDINFDHFGYFSSAWFTLKYVSYTIVQVLF